MDLTAIKAGADIPEDVNIVIEIPQGNLPVKYEFDKRLGSFVVDRFVATPMFNPANYGFIPHTLAGDGDPLDALLVAPNPVITGCVVRARPVGVLLLEDDGGMDEKIVAVTHGSLTRLYDKINDYEDLPDLLREQMDHYFRHYKMLEKGKWAKVTGWESREEAKKIINKAVANYRNA